jgi:hypothetical protein
LQEEEKAEVFAAAAVSISPHIDPLKFLAAAFCSSISEGTISIGSSVGVGRVPNGECHLV